MYENAMKDFTVLPVEAQRQVADFIAFLRQRYQNDSVREEVAATDFNDEPFVGMWRDREDMQDSTAWVREVREQEWTK